MRQPSPIPCEADLLGDGRKSPGICAFYFPQVESEWDKACGCAFLGNFFPARLQLKILGSMFYFRNAEAAFQALKYPDSADRFEHCDGQGAFRLRTALGDRADWSYSGHGSNWKAMRAVLDAKFQDQSLIDALLATGDSFLLEHNACVGRDVFWSDNGDGSGRNALGLQLMMLREELRAAEGSTPGRWTAWLQQRVDGEGLLPCTEREWQRAVGAATATVLKLFPLPGTSGFARMQARDAKLALESPFQVSHGGYPEVAEASIPSALPESKSLPAAPRTAGTCRKRQASTDVARDPLANRVLPHKPPEHAEVPRQPTPPVSKASPPSAVGSRKHQVPSPSQPYQLTDNRDFPPLGAGSCAPAAGLPSVPTTKPAGMLAGARNPKQSKGPVQHPQPWR